MLLTHAEGRAAADRARAYPKGNGNTFIAGVFCSQADGAEIDYGLSHAVIVVRTKQYVKPESVG